MEIINVNLHLVLDTEMCHKDIPFVRALEILRGTFRKWGKVDYLITTEDGRVIYNVAVGTDYGIIYNVPQLLKIGADFEKFPMVRTLADEVLWCKG